LPGRITTIAPANPATTHNQRSHETRSPNITAATTVSNKGVSITMAVNSPTGMTRRLRKAMPLHTTSSRPRTNCISGRFVTNRLGPRLGHNTAVVATACTP